MSNPQVKVVREDNMVTLSLKEVDPYAAMLLYDRIAAQIKSGYVALEIVGPRVVEETTE